MEAEKASAPEPEPVIELLDDITEDAGEPAGIVEISEERLAEAWKKVTDNISNPRVRSGLCKFSPVYDKETDTVTQYVLNAAQKDWIEKNLIVQLQSDLQKALENNDIALKVDFKENVSAGDSRRPYTTREVAEAMRSKNKDLAQMEMDLDLEIK